MGTPMYNLFSFGGNALKQEVKEEAADTTEEAPQA